ncbi:hypothetical protein [Streptosporangium lutulentum]|uniref:CU044_5270 family protein n=1 Tax=Streptosporangium lutulentum TaxID=1461250 RepID=A0ABT9QIU4_9ACTN|nr:hypothetical protein [Streptosporangium lutulentum]MDP9846671.1 hypothetical protein [Streptosporangium lutulentum]
MNEFRLIDDVMPDVPPSDPGKTAEARAGALNGGRPPRRRLGGLSPGRFGWVVAAVATVVVVVSVMVVPRLRAPEVSPVLPAVGPRQELDAAAASLAGRSEPAAGRYWRTTTEQTRLERIDSRYFVRGTTRQTLWWSTDQPKVTEQQFVGMKPLTSADSATWKRAGSPKLCDNGLPCEGETVLPGQTRYTLDTRQKARTVRQGLFSLDLETAESMKLPRDPVTLRSELLESWPAYLEKRVRAGVKPEMTMDDWLWEVGVGILEEMPTSPEARAALYRMLADIPGSRVLGGVKEVTVARPFLPYRESHVVIDRRTGTLTAIRSVLLKPDPLQKGSMADQTGLSPGTVIYEVAFVKMGWTDESFRLPGNCPSSMEKTGGVCVR